MTTITKEWLQQTIAEFENFDMRGGNQMNCIEHILVTHWRPMPAAPKPEQS